MGSSTSSPPGLVPRIIARVLAMRPVRAFLHYSEHRGPVLADSITYRTLFSLFAGVLLGFSVAALWLAGNPAAWQALVDAVDAAVPGLVGDGGLVDLDDIEAPAGLTVAGILSLVALVGAAIGAIGSLRTALFILADRVHDDVLIVWVLLRNLALAIGIGVALAAAAAAMFLADQGIGIVTGWFGMSAEDPLAVFSGRAIGILIVLVLDTAVVAVLFRTLSGLRVPTRTLLIGAAIGGIGLTVLQQLSTWFVGGASSNPLLATFASLIALLLWINLSTQVILIASSYIIVSDIEERDRVRARFGAPTFATRRLQRAEDSVRVATEELQKARVDVEKERQRA
ncbi:YihY/virulence factor BrkB family protein [Microbacterium sp. SLBN-146]|uniref:YihY/virulence factor BrkB family protein n=1 Tax=Microbacterium sp. SLBN-146 TaxID=2768457 RepID=UPI00114FD7F7|nr:YihY/virulence factor BrkB family protein [Microbacterium sp. SLBN-146]TQJ32398.1 membrane protein [Microbacterium sp. SLBN-146]